MRRVGIYNKIYYLFFSLSEKDVKSKINTLRSYFSAELKKATTKNGDGRDDVYESKWPHFKSLVFLRDSVAAKKTSSSMVGYYLDKPFLP